MAAYLVVDVNQESDPGDMVEYQAKVPELVARHGGRWLANGPPTVLEGDHRTQRLIIIEFDSVEQAQAAYDSAAYAPLKAQRQRSGSSTFLLVPAV